MKNTSPQPPSEGGIKTIQLIPLNQLTDSPSNPREKETPEQLQDLMNSIQERGLMQAITVRKLDGKEKYEVVAGHRRFWAFQELKAKEISAVVMELNDEEVAEYQLIENLQRTDIHPLKEAEVYSRLMSQELPYTVLGMSVKIGKSESYIAQRLQLLNLSKEARELYLKNAFSLSHATLLAKLTHEYQQRALNFILGGYWDKKKPETIICKDVKELRSWIELEIDMVLEKAPWDKKDSELIPGVPACLNCPKNSGYNTALFPELNGKHVCNDRTCFNAKLEAYFKQTRHASKKQEQKDFILLSDDYHMDTADPMYVKGAVKMKGRYVELPNEKKTCEHTKKGQYIDGPKKGKFVLVCNYSKCKKHFKSERASSSDEHSYDNPKNKAQREEAAKQLAIRIADEKEFRYNVMTAMLERCPKKMTLDLLRYLLRKLWEEFPGLMTDVARRHGWQIEGIDSGDWHVRKNALDVINAKMEELISSGKEDVLMELQHELAYGDLMNVDSEYDLKQTEGVRQVAKVFKLDLKKIRKETEKQLKSQIVNSQQTTVNGQPESEENPGKASVKNPFPMKSGLRVTEESKSGKKSSKKKA